MRLRKKKNALEKVQQSEYVVTSPKEKCGKWQEVFGNQKEIQIEIGMGKGLFLTQMACLHPEINFIGIEKYDSVMVTAIKRLEERETKLNNIKLICIDAKEIGEVFSKEISRIYLNFSDPWPKAKHAKRRLTSEEFLKRYDTIWKGKKEIFQKTDNASLFAFSMASLQAHGYQLRKVTNDLYQTEIEENVPTEYELKFVEKGMKINRLEAYQELQEEG